MKKLDPQVRILFFLENLATLTALSVFVWGCFVPSIIGTSNMFDNFRVLIIICCCIFAILLFAISYIFARLTYDNYMYELKEDGFYKESGIFVKKYVTIPYERIQNVDITRGIFARMLGLSDLQIQTAGMSYGSSSGIVNAEGRLPGITESEARIIRDELIKRAKGTRNNTNT